MKQVFIIGLCFATTVAFAQKAAVSGAERMAKDQKSNLNEARSLIKEAMNNAETKDDPKTWFVAAQIEDAQLSRETAKQVMGQEPNEPLMYEAVANALPLFIKAYELDQIPNAKGKVAPKYTRNIKSILSANLSQYWNGGVYYFENNNYQKAYELFQQYLDITNQPFFAGDKISAKDENYQMIQFFTAMAATQLNNPELELKALKQAKEYPYRQYDVYVYLVLAYDHQKDTDNLEKTLEEGIQAFPDSSYFLLNLINLYISSERNEKAIGMLTSAIAKDASNPQLYQAMGSVYESGYEDFTKAEENYIKALQYDQESPTALSNLGRIYFNEGISIVNEANQLTDVQAYNTEKEKAKELFKKALPYFEKAHQINPTASEYMIGLRGIYYQLEMTKEFSEIEAKMENR
jgi:hypothetical protein